MGTQNGTVAKTTTATARPKSSKATASKSDKDAKTIDAKALQTQLENAQKEAKENAELAKKANAKADALEKEAKAKKPLSLADALVKVTETKAVADRLDFLQRTRKDLSAFSLGSDGNRDVLTLRDGSGNVFESHNTDTITAVLSMLKSELDKKVEDTEKELLAIA